MNNRYMNYFSPASNVMWQRKETLRRPHTDTFLCGTAYSEDRGQVDQLEDRYLGMVEASGSNPDLSISLFF